MHETSLELDWADESDPEGKKGAAKFGLKAKVVNPAGPGGGWPIIEFIGATAKIIKLLKQYESDGLAFTPGQAPAPGTPVKPKPGHEAGQGHGPASWKKEGKVKTTNENIMNVISNVLAEAKKKKEKSDKAKKEVHPAAYSYAESFDFSAPLGAYNLYKSQGAVNWGPMTGPGTKIDDHVNGSRSEVRDFKEAVEKPSTFAQLSEMIAPAKKIFGSVWEAAQHWYDHEGLGLGKQTPDGIESKKKSNAKKAGKK